MVSQTAEYALRAVVVLSEDPDTPQTAQDIAAKASVPADYLIKVLQPLSRAGLVTSQRGRRGGFLLARPPGEISLLEVLTAVEPLRRIKRCPLGLKTHGVDLCPLHRKLDDAMRSFEQAFADTTIAAILAGPGTIRPLCERGVAIAHAEAAI